MSNTPQKPPIEPGMVVTSIETGLDEHDISQAKVKAVATDATGNVTEITVEKGILLKKDVVVPADRITEVDAAAGSEPGMVKIATSEAEIDALSAVGTETLPVDEPAAPPPAPSDLLSKAQEELPTAEGLGSKEGRSELGGSAAPTAPQSTNRVKQFFSTLGPGFLAGMAGNDASAVTSYSVNGATNGYGQLWLMLLSTPMFQAVQYACGKVGRVTKKGLAEVLREQYGTKLAVGASMLLIIANIGLVAGDLVAIGSGFELITGIAWLWFVVPAALFLWYITVFRNFATIKKVFLLMSLAFIAYLVTGIAAHPNWGQVLQHTFVPSLGFDFISISSAVALLGATVSPYTMFWQVQAEQEETRIGSLRQQLKSTRLDIANGVISGNLVAYLSSFAPRPRSLCIINRSPQRRMPRAPCNPWWGRSPNIFSPLA